MGLLEDRGGGNHREFCANFSHKHTADLHFSHAHLQPKDGIWDAFRVHWSQAANKFKYVNKIARNVDCSLF